MHVPLADTFGDGYWLDWVLCSVATQSHMQLTTYSSFFHFEQSLSAIYITVTLLMLHT